MPLDYPLWLRAAHFFNFLLLSLLIRSGLEILTAHPRLYWNDQCTPGSEWLKFTKKQRPEDLLWTASDEETSFPGRHCPARPRKSRSRTALALSCRLRMAADRFDIRADALRHSGMAAANPDFLADCPGG
jgi:hypothetical protein